MNTGLYVLITAARNEEASLEDTIHSVLSQTIRPRHWVIVSDNSTDRTADIVRPFLAANDFIQLIQIHDRTSRSFSSKVYAIQAGYQTLRNVAYDFIGILDADILLDPTYYERVLRKFAENPQLGLAGGVKYERHWRKFRRVLCAENSVCGAVQLFRRQSYERIGGLVPIEIGGEDAVAETLVRMHGWHVQSFPELRVYHLRPSSTAQIAFLAAPFTFGVRDYLLGYHPLFQLFRSIYRTIDRPYLLCGLLLFCGYWWAYLRRLHRPVPEEFLTYVRSEQLLRLHAVIAKIFRARPWRNNGPTSPLR